MLKLLTIPAEVYDDYRYEVILSAYKWDPQVGDHNTVSRHVLVIDEDTERLLEENVSRLARETCLMEQALVNNTKAAKALSLPRTIYKTLGRLKDYDPSQNVRLMRFDFHPTDKGWAISEVNSDVPGGLAESSLLPSVAAKYLGEVPSSNPDSPKKMLSPGKSTAESLYRAFEHKIKPNTAAAFIHATAYSDDRQVMQYLSDYFEERGVQTLLAAPDHIQITDKKAVCIAGGSQKEVGALIRFFPLEWFPALPRKSRWRNWFDCLTPSCNHPAAILTQSKRLPLIWDNLGVDLHAWKELLPETKSALKKQAEGWIYKPAFGRVGEDISIKEAVTQKEMKLIEKSVKAYPKDWVSQRRFNSMPLITESGETMHLCVGVFAVDGKSAGFYARISRKPRIDADAQDIPVLVIRH